MTAAVVDGESEARRLDPRHPVPTRATPRGAPDFAAAAAVAAVVVVVHAEAAFLRAPAVKENRKPLEDEQNPAMRKK